MIIIIIIIIIISIMIVIIISIILINRLCDTIFSLYIIKFGQQCIQGSPPPPASRGCRR